MISTILNGDITAQQLRAQEKQMLHMLIRIYFDTSLIIEILNNRTSYNNPLCRINTILTAGVFWGYEP